MNGKTTKALKKSLILRNQKLGKPAPTKKQWRAFKRVYNNIPRPQRGAFKNIIKSLTK